MCFTDGFGLGNKAARALIHSSYTGLLGDTTGSKYLDTRAIHFDGKLNGRVQALEESRGVNLLAILTGTKLAISMISKLDKGTASPWFEIQVRILNELCKRTHEQKDTSLAWVKGYKGIEGNEKADILYREASILGHESKGVVTLAGLKAWAKRVRAEPRGGIGAEILGWGHKVNISLHLVYHRKRSTTKVAIQDKEERYT